MDKNKLLPGKLSALFSLLTFLTLTVTLFLSSFLTRLLAQAGFLEQQSHRILVFIIAAVSVLTGTALSHFAGRPILKIIASISLGATEIAKGNFDITLDESIPVKELRDMARNFNLMAKELAGTEMLRTDFVENVSHEFKTPLSAIEGYATLLQKKNLCEEKLCEYTRKILSNTRRLSTLTSDILLLSRLENQEIGVARELFCLDEQLRECLLFLESGWSEKNLELEIDLDGADYCGNKDLLAHVWQNILGNAVKFAPYGGQIHVRLRRENGFLAVHIADNGNGMSEEVRRRVFEKFYQGDPSRSCEGSGLGLSLAKRIVDLHGGSIFVASEEGNGTAFTVMLPNGQNPG